MVRTFLCHPFKDPKAFTDQYDPTAICYTADDRVIIASVNGTFHVYNLKNINCPKLQRFSSLGIPLKLLFCNSKQFILSLETRLQEYKSGVSPLSTSCYVRVYWNFSLSVTNKVYPTVICGYSSSVKTNNCNKYLNNSVVIDLNVDQPASDVALCQTTDNVAVSSGRKIFVFSCKMVKFFVSEEEKDLIDFFKIIEIDSSFYIHNIGIIGNWISLASQTELRILQVFLSQPEDQNVYQAEDVSKFLESCVLSPTNDTSTCKKEYQATIGQSQVTDSVILDRNFVVWDFSQRKDTSVASFSTDKRSFQYKAQDQFVVDSDNSYINLTSISEETPYIDRNTAAKEITGPLENVVGHPLHCSVVFNTSHLEANCPQSFNGTVSCVTLLYRRFKPTEMSNSGDIRALHSLQWLPVFVEGENATSSAFENTSWPWNMFQLPSTVPLVTLAFFFSTGKQGYLYDFTGSVSQAAMYHYTSDCFTALHTSSMLYTVTKNGLETYTSRLYPLAAAHCLEMFKEVDLSSTSFHQQPAPYHKIRTETQQFADVNYFGSYVSVQEDGTVKADHEAMYQNPCIVYSPHDLALTCPPLDLDVCLVGMYLLQNIAVVGCSASYTGILVKAKVNKEKTSSGPLTPWSIYVLEKTVAADFYNQLTSLIKGNEFSNPTIYYQLSCEAHLLLRSELMSGLYNEGEMKTLLKESAINLADFLCRCTESFPFNLIPNYYSMSGLKFPDIIKRLQTLYASKEKKYVYSEAFMEYLNSILFTEKEIKLQKNHSEFILKLYFKNKPTMLSAVILKSAVKNFSHDLAAKYMSKFKKKQEGNGKKVAYFDYLCLAVLHMSLGNPDIVEELLKEIPEETLQKLSLDNYHLIFDDVHLITPLGQLVKKRIKSTFLSILVTMFDHGKFTADRILDIFKKKDDPISYSSQACKVFEALVNDGTRKKHFSKVVPLLIDQYLIRLVQMSKGLVADSWKTTHSHVPRGSGHFAPRFSWLDKLHPFTGEPPCPQDCVVNKASIKHKDIAGSSRFSPQSLPAATSGKPNSLQSSSLPSNKVKDDNNKRVYCPCCCCSEVLLKFQSLLCSRHNRKELSTHVLNKLSELSFIGKDSLLVLCWPKAGNGKEAVEYMVKNYPNSTLQYAKELFDWKAQWQLLLDHLLSALRNNDYEQWNQDAYIAVLKGVLLRLTRAYTPSEFLALLPADGAMQFFLPYLHECWEYKKSGVLQKQFLDMYKVTDGP